MTARPAPRESTRIGDIRPTLLPNSVGTAAPGPLFSGPDDAGWARHRRMLGLGDTEARIGASSARSGGFPRGEVAERSAGSTSVACVGGDRTGAPIGGSRVESGWRSATDHGVRLADRNAPPRSVIGRAMTLLAAFRPTDSELSLAELTRRTGIPKPTVHRLLAELAEWEIVERTGTGVRLGMRLFEFGSLVPRQRGLREIAAPFLSDLYEATRETVHLAVPDGVEVVYVQKIDSRQGPPLPSRVGGRMPASCTGVGKAMLAFAPPGSLAAVVKAGLVRRTPRSVIAPGHLARELAVVAERGIADEHEESTVGIACVAAPVLGPDGCAVAAVSVTGWVHRLDTGRLAPAVRTAALGITRGIGGRRAVAR